MQNIGTTTFCLQYYDIANVHQYVYTDCYIHTYIHTVTHTYKSTGKGRYYLLNVSKMSAIPIIGTPTRPLTTLTHFLEATG